MEQDVRDEDRDHGQDRSREEGTRVALVALAQGEVGQALGDHGVFGVAAQEDQGQEELVPLADHVEDRDGDEAGLGHGEHDLEEEPVVPGAVHDRGLGDAGGERAEERGQEEHRERQRIGDVDDHQARVGVEQGHVLEGLEQREQGQEHREHHPGGEPEVDDAVAGELVAGQHVRGHGAQQHRARDAEDHDLHGVEEVAADVPVRPGVHVVRPVHRLGRAERVGGDLAGGLEGGHDDPGHRDDDHERPQPQEALREHVEHVAFGPRGALRGPRRRRIDGRRGGVGCHVAPQNSIRSRRPNRSDTTARDRAAKNRTTPSADANACSPWLNAYFQMTPPTTSLAPSGPPRSGVIT